MSDLYIVQYLNEFNRAVNELKNNHSRYFDTKLLISYRGEPRDYGATKLMPSIYRNDRKTNIEHYLLELLMDYSLVEKGTSNIDKSIEAQHYVAVSRMLDISFSSLVALYFACSEEKSIEEDGYVYVFAFPEYYSPSSSYMDQLYGEILNSHHIAMPKNFKVLSHSYQNDRIRAQKGGFIFFPGQDYFPINKVYYKEIQISSSHKKHILRELETLFGLNNQELFPEKTNMANLIKSKISTDNITYNDYNLHIEIKSYINRLDYEIMLSNDSDRKKILRILRKEQDDLLLYVDSINDADEEALKKDINKEFELLNIKYMEVNNG